MNFRNVCLCVCLLLLPAESSGQTNYPHATYNPSSGAIFFHNLNFWTTGSRWINLYSNDGLLIPSNTEEFGIRQTMNPSKLSWWISDGNILDSTTYAGNVVVLGTALSDLKMEMATWHPGFCNLRGCDLGGVSIVAGTIIQIPEPSVWALTLVLALSLPRRFP
jgi:hypothetical protein